MRRVLSGRLRGAASVVCFAVLGCGGRARGEADDVDAVGPPPQVRVGEGIVEPNAFCSPTSFAVGMSHTCRLDALGQLSCSGTINDAPVPPPPPGTFRSLSSGTWQSCAIDDTGSVKCWGSLYTPSETPTLRPTLEPPAGSFRAIAAGGAFACGITLDDELVCWGDAELLAEMPATGTFEAVAAGTLHACAIRTEGTLVCWGFADASATAVPEGTFRAIAAGEYQTCALRTDGTIACWGAQVQNVPFAPPPAGPFESVSVGGHPGAFDWYACAIREDGSAECWSTARPSVAFPSGPRTGTFASLAPGNYQMCEVSMDCNVACDPIEE